MAASGRAGSSETSIPPRDSSGVPERHSGCGSRGGRGLIWEADKGLPIHRADRPANLRSYTGLGRLLAW
jgi:hypothetical protein